MPEQLTKHPDVTLQVLKSGGAVCAQGAPQEILTRCPAERFCKLPGGEVCVYGLPDAPQMTQPSAADWRALAQAVAPEGAAPARQQFSNVQGGKSSTVGSGPQLSGPGAGGAGPPRKR